METETKEVITYLFGFEDEETINKWVFIINYLIHN